MKQRIGWGFIGTGSIANRFIKDIERLPNSHLAAVTSRNHIKAQAFADIYGGKAYESVDQLLQDKEVDVIYIATPHTLHAENALQALEMGKPVLCEKPMAPNASHVRQMVSKARQKGVYLMEAMWTRFFPAIKQAKTWVDQGEIGQVRHITADFGFLAEFNPASRLFNPNLAGGSLVDVGIYPLAFASMIYGRKPDRIASMAEMATTGVDASMSAILGYDNGGMATLYSAINTPTLQEARIYGEQGHITIPKFWSPRKAILYKQGQISTEFSQDHEGEGFQFEIAAVEQDLREGRLESAIMPLDESIEIAETMDAIRAQWGLVYPFEK